MKFRLERDVLADAVAWAARTLPSRPSMPMLAGLLIDAGPGGLTLSSFDYEVSGRVAVAADVDEPGRVLVSGRLLADIARALPAAPVTVTSEGSRVEVRCGRSSFTLPTLPGRRLPRRCPTCPAPPARSPGATFAAAVAQVAIAAGRDDTLPDPHRHPRRDRRLADHARGHRPLPPRRPRVRVEPGASPASRPTRSCPRARWPTPRSRSRTATSCTSRSPHPVPATASWASRATAVARRPACSTASSRSTARCSPASRPPSPRSRPRRSSTP